MNAAELERVPAGTFFWWDSALDVANRRAFVTGRRHAVKADGERWTVEEVSA